MATMHEQAKSISWNGESFFFQRLTISQPGSDPSLWAVFRHGEFIGTMFCPPEVTPTEFELRGVSWAEELLNESSPVARR
jgi:hypothetical protein